jgi:hypothetical protein
MRHKRPRFLRIARVWVRRRLARIDRRHGGWALLVTPWGASLAIHSVMLVLLGIYFYAYMAGRDGGGGNGFDTSIFASQLTEDLTTLTPADKSGDPFTRLQSPEPPSLSFEPVPPDITKINLPQIRPGMTYGSELRLSASEVPRNLGQTVDTPGMLGIRVGPVSVPFSGRQGDAKAKLVRREGGTVESEKAVERGLDWIARHQRSDGSWGLDVRTECKGSGCPDNLVITNDVGATGLGLLPILGAGLTHTEPSRHQDVLKRGLSWLMRTQKPGGEIMTEGTYNSYMYSHAIASMALCEAYGLTRDKRLRDPAQKAINFIANSQNLLDGGWRYQPNAPGDTSVFGWQIFALRSARLAGLTVSKGTLQRCRTYLDGAAADDIKSTYSYMPGRAGTFVMTAEALLGRQILGWQRDYPPMLQGAAMISADLNASEERNIYYWYYATQLLHNLQGKDWERWNKKVRDGLVATQVGGDGCNRGSWDPLDPQPDRWGKAAGRLYETSLSILTLEVYYRYLPLYRARDTKLEGNDDTDEPAQKAKAAPASAARGGESGKRAE